MRNICREICLAQNAPKCRQNAYITTTGWIKRGQEENKRGYRTRKGGAPHHFS